MPAGGLRTALGTGMGIGSLVSLSSGYLESLFANPTGGSSPANAASTAATASGSTQDTNQLSPFAQLLSSLQQLQQSNPSQYQQVTQQIAGNLQTAAQSAKASGDTSLANQLTQLSTDFSSASASGQLPNIQDLAQAIGRGHLDHHSGNDSDAGGSTTSSAGSTSGVNQLIQSLNPSQSNSIANNSLNPFSIIDATLASAGIQVG
jgi:hypothetical protein